MNNGMKLKIWYMSRKKIKRERKTTRVETFSSIIESGLIITEKKKQIEILFAFSSYMKAFLFYDPPQRSTHKCSQKKC